MRRSAFLLSLAVFLLVSSYPGRKLDEFEKVKTKPVQIVPVVAAEICDNGLDDNHNGLIDEGNLCRISASPQTISISVIDWDENGSNPIFKWEGAEIVSFAQLVCVDSNNIRQSVYLPKARSGRASITLLGEGESCQCQVRGFNSVGRRLWSNIIII